MPNIGKHRLGAKIPKELIDYLEQIEDAEAFVDLAAHTVCTDIATKRLVLETLNTQ